VKLGWCEWHVLLSGKSRSELRGNAQLWPQPFELLYDARSSSLLKLVALLLTPALTHRRDAGGHHQHTAGGHKCRHMTECWARAQKNRLAAS
jgi:hypothetical protein